MADSVKPGKAKMLSGEQCSEEKGFPLLFFMHEAGISVIAPEQGSNYSNPRPCRDVCKCCNEMEKALSL